MSRATLATVKKIVYENISASTGSYGTLDSTNKRYLSGYIDDAIISADITVVDILLKAKQDILLQELYATQDVNSGDVLNNSWAIIKIECFPNPSNETVRAVEMDWDSYKLVSEGGIFSDTYKGYYAIKDGIIYLIPIDINSGSGAEGIITYINLTHPTTLSSLMSPSGFETVISDLASAKLLMKRLDKPEEAQFYKQNAYQFLQEYGATQYQIDEKVDR